MTYTLRVSARTLETSNITGIETPVQIQLAGKPATFVMQHRNLIVKISEFATEAEAEAFLPRLHAGLWNIALVQNLPFVLEQGRGDITYADDPVKPLGTLLERNAEVEQKRPPPQGQQQRNKKHSSHGVLAVILLTLDQSTGWIVQ